MAYYAVEAPCPGCAEPLVATVEAITFATKEAPGETRAACPWCQWNGPLRAILANAAWLDRDGFAASKAMTVARVGEIAVEGTVEAGWAARLREMRAGLEREIRDREYAAEVRAYPIATRSATRAAVQAAPPACEVCGVRIGYRGPGEAARCHKLTCREGA